MAVPKRRTSKMKTRLRRSVNMRASAPTLVKCPQCHEPKLTHRVCRSCGHYAGRTAITVEDAD